MEITAKQFARLPKYAQEYIEALQRREDSLARKVDELTGHEQTGVAWRDGGHSGHLPKHAIVYWKLDDGRRIEITRCSEYGGIVIRTQNRMMLLPRNSNCASIIDLPWGATPWTPKPKKAPEVWVCENCGQNLDDVEPDGPPSCCDKPSYVLQSPDLEEDAEVRR